MDLKGYKAKEITLRNELEDAKKRLEIMKKLFSNERATSSEIRRAKAAVIFKNYELYEVLKEINIVKQTIALKTLVVEEELIERGTNTLAPDDGIVVDIFVNKRDNTSPATSLLSFAKKGSGIQVEVVIPATLEGEVRLGDEVIIERIKNQNNKSEYINKVRNGKIVYSKGKITKLSDIKIDIKDQNGEVFKGLIGTITFYEQPKYEVNDEVLVRKYTGLEDKLGLSAFSLFDISEDQSRAYVYIIENGRAKKIMVKLGIKHNLKYEILNLPKGAEVIADPHGIEEGEEVKI
jgi:hypothetical protein